MTIRSHSGRRSKVMNGPMTAHFSEGREYRYRLDRVWDAKNLRRLVVIGLNPSTADETNDDPTIRRCIGFAKRENCGGLIIVNLFALRATDPTAMEAHQSPVGDENDSIILTACASPRIVVAAWGCHGAHLRRGVEVRTFLRARGLHLHNLGLTKDGHPKHPLRLAASTPLTLWESG